MFWLKKWCTCPGRFHYHNPWWLCTSHIAHGANDRASWTWTALVWTFRQVAYNPSLSLSIVWQRHMIRFDVTYCALIYWIFADILETLRIFLMHRCEKIVAQITKGLFACSPARQLCLGHKQTGPKCTWYHTVQTALWNQPHMVCTSTLMECDLFYYLSCHIKCTLKPKCFQQ